MLNGRRIAADSILRPPRDGRRTKYCDVNWIKAINIVTPTTARASQFIAGSLVYLDPRVERMFKKAFNVKSLSSVRASERKKLQADLANIYNVSPDGLVSDAVKTGKFACHTGEKGTIYIENGNPVWFSFEKQPKAAILPSSIIVALMLVYSLLKFPDILPKIVIFDPVAQYLSDGAGIP